MRIRTLFMLAGLATTLSFSSQSHAHEAITFDHTGTVSGHAPIGVMADHMHKKGEWMVSYRVMHMDMAGNRQGTDGIDPTTIVTTIPNPNAGPATLRVVPTDMSMDMHMFGTMYAPTDWLTLSAMIDYIEKDMTHITYATPIGTTVLGEFTTHSSGWGDTKLAGLIRLYDDEMHHVHLKTGLSLPTGSIDEEARVLTPANTTPVLRMPYSMQLGTGTYDFLPGITYTGHKDVWGWGAQYSAEIRLEDENDEGYAWGDKHQLTTWASYQWAPWISTSARITATTQQEIKGSDTAITAPVQTADPNNYGGQTIDIGLGVNLLGTENNALKGHRLAAEATFPLYRDLNGVQLETDFQFTLGWQKSF